MRVEQGKETRVPQSWPGVQASRRCFSPPLAWQRAQSPGHLAGAVGQPGKNTLAGAVRCRGAGAEVDHPFGLNTGPEDRRACHRFQAVRSEMLGFHCVTNRHIVLSEMYNTTGCTGMSQSG